MITYSFLFLKNMYTYFLKTKLNAGLTLTLRQRAGIF